MAITLAWKAVILLKYQVLRLIKTVINLQKQVLWRKKRNLCLKLIKSTTLNRYLNNIEEIISVLKVVSESATFKLSEIPRVY